MHFYFKLLIIILTVVVADVVLVFVVIMIISTFTFITRRPFWSPWGIKALSLYCLCPSSLTLNERFDGQNLLFGH